MAERPLYIDGNDPRRLGVDGLLNTRSATGTFANLSGARISKPKFVFWDEATSSIQLADNTTLDEAFLLGVVIEDIADLGTGLVQTAGIVEATVAEWQSITGGVGLISGRQYFILGSGNIQDSAPSGGYIAPVGQAVGTTKFLIRPFIPILQV